jgi:hypothetical protein
MLSLAILGLAEALSNPWVAPLPNGTFNALCQALDKVNAMPSAAGSWLTSIDNQRTAASAGVER